MADDEQKRMAKGLGKAVTMRRTELGMKRGDLRERSTLSYPFISEIENGRKQPSPESLYKLANALDMTVTDLLGLAEFYANDDEPGTGAASVVSMSQLARESAAQDRTLSDERAYDASDVRSPQAAPTSFEDGGVASLSAVDAAHDTLETSLSADDALSAFSLSVAGHTAAAASPETPGPGVDDVRQIVRDELERWAVDVLPILIRQELRRARHDRNG